MRPVFIARAAAASVPEVDRWTRDGASRGFPGGAVGRRNVDRGGAIDVTQS